MPARHTITDEAVLVRGGALASRGAVSESAGDARATIGVHGISVDFFVVDQVADALKRTMQPHAQVRLSTAGRVRREGLDVIATGRPDHATIVLPDPIDDETWARLQVAFDPPIKNPYRRRRQR